MNPLFRLALLAASAAQDPAAGKYLVKDGKTTGVFYGESIVMNLCGNLRRQVWTLRAYCALLYGAPEGGFELDVPQAWTSKELEHNGTKTLMIVPPSGEADYVIQMIPSEAGLPASAVAPGAIQELRDLVKQLAPAMKPLGDVETLKAGDLPVSGVVYSSSNEKAEVVLVKAYLVISKKKAVVLLAVRKEARDKEYGAPVRKALAFVSFTWPRIEGGTPESGPVFSSFLRQVPFLLTALRC